MKCLQEFFEHEVFASITSSGTPSFTTIFLLYVAKFTFTDIL